MEDETISLEETLDELQIVQNFENSAHVNYIPYTIFISRTLPRLIAAQRALAYASEVGESFRPVTFRWIVNLSYGLSFLYVGADTYLKAVAEYEKPISPETQLHRTGIVTLDTLIWHSMASIVFPGLSIHTIVKYAKKGVAATSIPQRSVKLGAALPTVIGLASIPFVIHPLDHLADFIMDNVPRKFYSINVVSPHEKKE